MHLTVNAAAISRLVHHGTKVLSLTGAVADTALIREVQWDPFGIDVWHIDFTRVSRGESVEVTVPIEVQGIAPGTNEGGQLTITTHDLTILCPASNVPEHLEVNVSDLHMGQSILAEDIPLPQGATLVTPGKEVLVQVEDLSAAEEAAEEAETAGEEPDLIAKGGAEEEEND
jgi:large subunit ribosomal protein L25